MPGEQQKQKQNKENHHQWQLSSKKMEKEN
jgi:hypothetical protein